MRVLPTTILADGTPVRPTPSRLGGKPGMSAPSTAEKRLATSTRNTAASRPAVLYMHIADQYGPFHTKVAHVGVRDSTYLLDGLLYHELDLRIEEHFADAADFTPRVRFPWRQRPARPLGRSNA